MADPAVISASKRPLTFYDLEEKHKRKKQKKMIGGVASVNKDLLARDT